MWFSISVPPCGTAKPAIGHHVLNFPQPETTCQYPSLSLYPIASAHFVMSMTEKVAAGAPPEL
jgi:hypothetical protein